MPLSDATGLLADDAGAVPLGGGEPAVWAEGPVWVPERRAVRYSDIPNNRILEWNQDTRRVGVYASDVEFTNGRTLDLDGAVVQCSHGRRRIEVDRQGVVSELVGQWRGHRLNSPNDVVVKSDGTVWFSDPSFGIKRPAEGHAGDLEYGDHWVFRFDPASREIDPAIMDVELPNGLAFSPDETILYVADMSVDQPDQRPNPAGTHWIRAYDVQGGRWCKNGRIFAVIEQGIPDGIRVDERGNVWSSALDGVHVFDPAGSEICFIPVPEKVGNLCFGGGDGRTLFIAGTTQLYQVATNVRDAAAVLRG